MREPAAGWEQALRVGAERSARVQILSSDRVIADSADGTLSVLSGAVTAERTRRIRTSAQLSVLDIDRTIGSLLDPLTVTEVRVWGGLNGDLHPLITGAPTSPKKFVLDDGSWRWDLQLQDRAKAVSDQPFYDPYKIPQGENLVDAIVGILTSRLGFGVTVNATPITDTLAVTTTYTIDDNPWDVCLDLADTAGVEVYFDGSGQPVINDRPDPSGPVTWSHPAQVNPSEQNDSTLYNGVMVVATGSWLLFPITGLATIDDLDDPLRWGGPLGKRPLRVESAHIASQTKADTMALERLKDLRGRQSTLQAGGTPFFAAELGDHVRFESLGSSGLLDRITWPLLAGVSEMTGRRSNV